MSIRRSVEQLKRNVNFALRKGQDSFALGTDTERKVIEKINATEVTISNARMIQGVR